MVEAPEGPLVVEFATRAAELPWAERIRTHRPGTTVAFGGCTRTVDWLDGYFEGEPRPAPYPEHLDQWLPLTPPQVRVWRALSAIPLGETRSYDDIARLTGLHPRLVGQLNGANHLALWIPCHRVVGKSGALVGYGGGLERKRWLLAHELRVTGLVLRPGPG